MEARPHQLGKFLHVLIWTLILVGLYLSSHYSYLLFHSLAELFSIVIAVGVFAIAWNSRRFLENNYLLQRHGGRVWAEGAVNQGATFYFTLEGQPGNEVS